MTRRRAALCWLIAAGGGCAIGVLANRMAVGYAWPWLREPPVVVALSALWGFWWVRRCMGRRPSR
jgi:hypothetical protein